MNLRAVCLIALLSAAAVTRAQEPLPDEEGMTPEEAAQRQAVQDATQAYYTRVATELAVGGKARDLALAATLLPVRDAGAAAGGTGCRRCSVTAEPAGSPHRRVAPPGVRACRQGRARRCLVDAGGYARQYTAAGPVGRTLATARTRQPRSVAVHRLACSRPDRRGTHQLASRPAHVRTGALDAVGAAGASAARGRVRDHVRGTGHAARRVIGIVGNGHLERRGDAAPANPGRSLSW